MKRVHIVNPYLSVAMLRMTDPLKELSALYEISMSETVDPSADLNIHVPLHTLAQEVDLGSGKHIACYTHCNPGAQGELILACERADIVTTMSFTGRQELLSLGVDPKKIWTVYAGADLFNYRKRTILIVGYPQPNGRKRESLLLDLAWKYDLSQYEFFLAGQQWEDVANKVKSLGVTATCLLAQTPDVISRLYKLSDVFVATGYVEGGPLPLLEAMASGTKVFSPRFGYASDLLDDDNLYDTSDELMQKLDDYFAESVFHHQLARSWNWHDYAAEYALLSGRLLDESVDLYPKRGMSRYAQLIDIIDEIKPKSICEIGTWNGNRAIQMLQASGKYHEMKRITYQGFDLFESQTGEQFTRELSKHGYPMEVVQRRIEATGANVKLTSGNTLDTIYTMSVAEFYFVDGGHSEETIHNDGSLVTMHIASFGGVAIFDDYYHAGKPEGMGCNKFIDALDTNIFEVIHLPHRTLADDGREIGMVEVRLALSISLPTATTTYTHLGTPSE